MTSTLLFIWLQEGDAKAAAWQAEMDAHGTDQITNLFATTTSSSGGGGGGGGGCGNSDNDSDDDDASAASVLSGRSDADYEGTVGRVRVWTSSTTNVDGFGSRYKKGELSLSSSEQKKKTTSRSRRRRRQTNNNEKNDDEDDEEEADDDDHHPSNDHGIRIVYILSENCWEGYGDLLWASSRHLANQLADPVACQKLLLLAHHPLEFSWNETNQTKKDHQQHPLTNLCVLELGAGCGVPSLMAMKCGAAAVVCTDLDHPNRIRCLAEAMERNWREDVVLKEEEKETTTAITQMQQHYDNLTERMRYPARVCPFRWGSSTGPVLKTLQEILSSSSSSSSSCNNKNYTGSTTPGNHDKGNESDETCCRRLFDVICATDCLFMPWLHDELLDAVQDLLSPNGVAIFAFAIHEAYSKEEQVWPFVDKAKEKGFHVEILPAVQLTPPRKGMDAKQGLVHQLLLTRSAGPKDVVHE